ncbi:hypothetical protein [Lachnobacterium bovis]|uniref:hypothetical protein n=1 Tax=Lachnobacterium bovis TaxID=140626 RepID=UPI003B506231
MSYYLLYRRLNYKFDGWYLDVGFTHRVDILNKDMPDHLSLYAQMESWKLIMKKIFKISHINLQF